ncbi:L-glutamine synthetase [Salsuginibacillus halophilus]|uniref:Glutamine synthetase n=1 Tax=Salsuginibacillus halophilus TaxID=517424 RepID=A0A2P8HXP5_9BACI|nr:type I glutamate--ammonia ligase [Salsuginibacillus halophilus]PSL51001.1 L-glutamine synthetase [Salsuginibacillus halophilus]
MLKTYVPSTNTNLESIREIIEKNDVELLHLQFVDIEGLLKNVTVTSEQLEDAAAGQMMFDGSSIHGFSTINQSDLYLQPDLNTFAVLPWTVESDCPQARFICFITYPDGTPFEGDPRFALKRTADYAAKLGYAISVGPELEFFLFETDNNGEPIMTTQDQGGYFETSPRDDGEKVRIKIYQTLRRMGFTIEASHHEVATGQHEINFKFQDALSSADAATTYKWVVKTVAQSFGYHASFMPKPFGGANGSGMHTNISLFDTEAESNAFYGTTDDKELSTTAYQFIAGLLNNVGAFTAVTNPLVNSYKRLVPGYEAPCYIAWSASNRSALIRIPATRGGGTRVEIRCPDPSANPYLAFAMIAAAGLDGIENGLTAPEEVTDDIFSMDDASINAKNIDHLPTSLEKAVDAFEANGLGEDILGSHIFNEYLKLKREEWDSFRTTVHDWEISQYQRKF